MIYFTRNLSLCICDLSSGFSYPQGHSWRDRCRWPTGFFGDFASHGFYSLVIFLHPAWVQIPPVGSTNLRPEGMWKPATVVPAAVRRRAGAWSSTPRATSITVRAKQIGSPIAHLVNDRGPIALPTLTCAEDCGTTVDLGVLIRRRRRTRDGSLENRGDGPRPGQLGLLEELARGYEDQRIELEIRTADLAAREARAEALMARINELEDALARANAEHSRQVGELETGLAEARIANEEQSRYVAELKQEQANHVASLEQARAEIARLQSFGRELADARAANAQLETAVRDWQQALLRERQVRQRIQGQLRALNVRLSDLFGRQLKNLDTARSLLDESAGLDVVGESDRPPPRAEQPGGSQGLQVDSGVAQDSTLIPPAAPEGDASPAVHPVVARAAPEAPPVSTSASGSESDPDAPDAERSSGTDAAEGPGATPVAPPPKSPPRPGGGRRLSFRERPDGRSSRLDLPSPPAAGPTPTPRRMAGFRRHVGRFRST